MTRLAKSSRIPARAMDMDLTAADWRASAAAVNIGSRIGGVLQNLKDASVARRPPHNIMRRWPVERSYWHQEIGLLKMAHHRLGAAQLAKLGEQMEQPRVHFFIGIEANPAIVAIRQPGRQRHPQLASRHLLPLALM